MDNFSIRANESNLMSSHDDTAETAGIFDDGDRVHLFQTLVHHTGTADIGETGGASITATTFVPTSAHVQLGNDHRQIVGRQAILPLQVFAHVG